MAALTLTGFGAGGAAPGADTGSGTRTNAGADANPLAKIFTPETAYADGAPVATDIASAEVTAIPPKTYTGKAIKPIPAVYIAGAALVAGRDFSLAYENNKLPGTATVTLTGIPAAGCYGQKTVTFRIVIKTPALLKAKVTGKDLRQITFSWKKVAGATGYRIYYAKNAAMTKDKKTKTLEGAGTTSFSIDHPYYKRNYYVRVRAYQTIRGENYYSDTTATVKLTTKNLKWILVDLSKQRTYCKLGKKTKKKYTISSGKSATPTIKGTFYIYMKRQLHTMVGIDHRTGKELYRQPNVRWISYFRGGYAFHATYWHNNFGRPMSHGCVNMRTKDAKWLYKWAPMGTKVVVRS